MGRDYTQLILDGVKASPYWSRGASPAWMKLRLRRNGRENAAAPSQVDYIEQELLFVDFTGALSYRHLYYDLYYHLLQ